MEENTHKKLVHNMSSPLLLGKDNNIIKDKYLSNKSEYKNIKFEYNKKLSPLKTSNKIILKKISLTKNLFNPILLQSRNKKSISKSCDLELSGEIAKINANKMMNIYFYPDNEIDHEKSNKLNEKININKMLTFYSKLKNKKEREDVKKMINKQKKKYNFYK